MTLGAIGHKGLPRWIVDETSGCWLWQKTLDRHGYGHTTYGQLAHRVVYEMHRGQIPAGLQLDHLCRVRHCVNPDHLEPVTLEENRRRGLDARGYTVDRELCGNGHSMADAYVEPGTGQRKCRECRRMWTREWARRKAAERRALDPAS